MPPRVEPQAAVGSRAPRARPTVAPGLALDRARNQARTLAESVPPQLRLGYARSFCTALLQRYWQQMKPRCTRNLRTPPLGAAEGLLGKEDQAVAVFIADLAAELEPDDAGYLVGRTYAVMLPEDFRAENGVYYTPPTVAHRLIDGVTEAGIDWQTCRAVDPACGGGAFLGPLARKMLQAMPGANRRIAIQSIASRLVGLELDAFSAWISRVFLDVTLNAQIGGPGDETFDPIQIGDTLKRTEEARFDLVIGNPPYGRVRLAAGQRAKFARSLYGHANLYGLFLDQALRQTTPTGVVGFVTPTGFLCGEYFKNLRALLASEAAPISFDLIHEREGVFDDVLQETLLTVFRKGSKQRVAKVNFVEASQANLTVSCVGTAPLPSKPELPWIVPRERDAVKLAARLRTMTSRLADWGYGVSTGPLVWNRHKDQLRDEPAKGTVPLLWAECVSADGAFSFRATRRHHSPYFLLRPEDGSLLVRSPCVLLQRTTAKEQIRRLIAAELSAAFIEENEGVTVENHLNMVVAIVKKPPVPTAALAAFLNSIAADRAFRCISGTVAVSAYELEALPLPPAWAMREVAKLVADGRTTQEVEHYCLQLYGEG